MKFPGGLWYNGEQHPMKSLARHCSIHKGSISIITFLVQGCKDQLPHSSQIRGEIKDKYFCTSVAPSPQHLVTEKETLEAWLVLSFDTMYNQLKMANSGREGGNHTNINLLKEKLTMNTLLMKHKYGGRICAQQEQANRTHVKQIHLINQHHSRVSQLG